MVHNLPSPPSAEDPVFDTWILGGHLRSLAHKDSFKNAKLFQCISKSTQNLNCSSNIKYQNPKCLLRFKVHSRHTQLWPSIKIKNMLHTSKIQWYMVIVPTPKGTNGKISKKTPNKAGWELSSHNIKLLSYVPWIQAHNTVMWDPNLTPNQDHSITITNIWKTE